MLPVSTTAQNIKRARSPPALRLGGSDPNIDSDTRHGLRQSARNAGERSEAGYEAIAADIAASNLPTVIVMEGGYAVDALGSNTAAFLAAF